MARLPRFVLPGHPQHVIQRGNNRQERDQWGQTRLSLMLGREDRLVKPHSEYQCLGSTGEERQAAYRALFQAHLADKTLDEIRQATNKAWVLGEERFKRRIEAQLKRRVEPKARGGRRKSSERTVNRV